MKQQYSHRNGETEPPTILEHHYWFKGDEGSGYDDEGPLVFVMPAEKDIGPYIYSDCYEVGGRVPIADMQGQWWGPVLPPWAEDD